VFAGCQSSEDLTSPVSEELEKRGGHNNNCSIVPVNTIPGAPTCVELVAGQHTVVGNVCIETVGSNLKVTYNITENGWVITETHLAVVGNPDHFPRNNNGNPKVGHFPFKGTHNNVNSVEYLVPINNLPSQIYVAAHAVVEKNNQTSSGNLCLTFPENSNMIPVWLPSDATEYTVKATIDSGTYYGFCVDNSRYIGSGTSRIVNFLCSYDDMPICTSPQFFLENPGNLDLVNWIINNSQPNWNRAVMQAAIWKLINPSGTLTGWDTSTVSSGEWKHDPILREEIISLAQAHEGFIPECGQKVLMLVYGPGEICNPTRQVIAFEVPVECTPGECESETAWAFPYNNGPIQDKSAKFGSQWARYFSYLK
jgi:hypothetical protein